MAREYVLQPFNPPADLHIDYAAELNEQQFAAVTAPPGPALVIAGAGSGKTRTLTYRTAYLLEQGIPSDRILLLTFTNKAAKEMLRRVGDLLQGNPTPEWSGTFHSIGNRILRRHADLLGYGRDFTILDREDANDLIKASLGESDVDIGETRFPKADLLGDIFSSASNTRRSVEETLAQDYAHFAALAPQIVALQARFTARKLAANAMDFDDLLELWLRLLRTHPDVLELYQRRFQFILVDEYQDTNRLQGELIDLLAARHGNVMVVGDDAQSIYAWRGADFENIIRFPERYPKAAVYKIETNYRSTPEILQVANAAIQANVRQFAKVLAPDRKSGSKPVLVACEGPSEQAAFICQRVLQLRDEGVELERMAVLYRSHFHALELQLELTRRNIPFSITSGIRFFEQAHIKDIAAYLRFVTNARDEIACKRIAQLMPGVGGKAAEKLWTKFSSTCKGESGTPWPAASLDAPAPLATALQACTPVVPKKAALAWAQFAITVSQLEAAPVAGNPGRMIGVVVEAGYEEHLRETYPNHATRLDDVRQLQIFAGQFKTTADFLAQLALLTNLEAEADKPAARDTEQLKLSTVHQAKGLEFDVVFVIMLCEGAFPSARSLDVNDGEEEERRLFYVAVTRARNELYLCHPIMRMVAGGGYAVQQPSRFLQEIPADLLECWDLVRPGLRY